MYKFVGQERLGNNYLFRIVQDTDTNDFFVDCSYKRNRWLKERRRFSTLSSARVYVSKHLKD